MMDALAIGALAVGMLGRNPQTAWEEGRGGGGSSMAITFCRALVHIYLDIYIYMGVSRVSVVWVSFVYDASHKTIVCCDRLQCGKLGWKQTRAASGHRHMASGLCLFVCVCVCFFLVRRGVYLADVSKEQKQKKQRREEEEGGGEREGRSGKEQVFTKTVDSACGKMGVSCFCNSH